MALKTVEIAKAFTLTRDNGTEKFYPVGLHVMPAEDADHWYTKTHIAEAPPPKLGDLAYAQALRQEADRRRASWLEADEQAGTAEEAYLATVQTPEQEPDEEPPDDDTDAPPPGPVEEETAARLAAEEEARLAAEEEARLAAEEEARLAAEEEARLAAEKAAKPLKRRSVTA
jgi:hypothetical protein